MALRRPPPHGHIQIGWQDFALGESPLVWDRTVVYDRYHYILDLTAHITKELYDYVDDPIELRNLAGQGLIEEQIMHQALARFLQTSEIPEGMED